jgi:Lar family restriction alleviation protein
MIEKLKPCPFCGQFAEVLEQVWNGELEIYMVRCRCCFSTTGRYTSKNRAIELWNRRSNDEKID